MTHPYPPPPRRLSRSTSDRYVAGVCGGIARYLNLDPAVVRILTVLLTTVFGGVPILIYLVALFVLPEDDRAGSPPPPGIRPPEPPWGGYGHQPPAHRPADPVWGREGAPWEQPQPGAQAPRDPDAPRDRT